jgi:ATP-dependent Clp protease, protease subunit
MQHEHGMEIVAQSESDAEVYIYDSIGAGLFGGFSAKDFAGELRKLPRSIQNLNVHINSPGGNIFDGMAIMNQLVKHKAHVTVAIDGMALSAASVIAMAGDEIEMADNAAFMIHDPHTITGGNAKQFRKVADVLELERDNIIRAYQRQVVLDHEVLAGLMDAETWMSADEALAFGFIDKVTKSVAVAAWSPDVLAQFGYKHQAPKIDARSEEPNVEDDESQDEVAEVSPEEIERIEEIKLRYEQNTLNSRRRGIYNLRQVRQ